jgi:hypothetical protein
MVAEQHYDDVTDAHERFMADDPMELAADRQNLKSNADIVNRLLTNKLPEEESNGMSNN